MNEKWDGVDRRAQQRWRVKREISVGDIFAFTMAALAVVMAYSTLDKRLQRQEDLHAAWSAAQRDIDRRQDEDQLRTQGRIEQSIRALDDKVERLLDRTRRISPP